MVYISYQDRVLILFSPFTIIPLGSRWYWSVLDGIGWFSSVRIGLVHAKLEFSIIPIFYRYVMSCKVNLAIMCGYKNAKFYILLLTLWTSTIDFLIFLLKPKLFAGNLKATVT